LLCSDKHAISFFYCVLHYLNPHGEALNLEKHGTPNPVYGTSFEIIIAVNGASMATRWTLAGSNPPGGKRISPHQIHPERPNLPCSE
jgi:hypothetical protein